MKESLSCWCDFAFELINFFKEWIKCLEIFSFDELKKNDNIRSNKKKLLCSEMHEHILYSIPKVKSIAVLVNLSGQT